MRKHIAVLFLASIAAIASFAVASNSAGQSLPTTAPGDIGDAIQCSSGDLGSARSILHDTFTHKRWQHRHPLGDETKQHLDDLASCLSAKDKKDLKDYKSKVKLEFFTYRKYRQVATEPGLKGEGPYLEYLVIPAWVVQAETNGYSGEGRWHAQNPSGACGPYQLLGWTSCSVRNNQDKLRMHIVASKLPRGSWAVGY